MEGADGSSTGEGARLVGAMQQNCKTIRGDIRATHVKVVSIGGSTSDAVWSRCILRTSTMECILQNQQRWMSSIEQTSLSTIESSVNDCWWHALLTNGHTGHTC